jgi:L,D-peptidoglycan transpeptidase YkuD (ErfK/YbiS/YcfS/YnhG family)
MKRRLLSVMVLAAAVGGLALAWQRWRGAVPGIPRNLMADIPASCRQLLLVLSPEPSSKHARLWLLERAWSGGWWSVRHGPLAATLGHKGLAWGAGEHRRGPPPGFPVKLEGDKCSPAGVFRIPFAFGIPPREAAAHLKLPYTPLTAHLVGVDDVTSKFYNQIVDDREVLRDWMSHEAMNRHTKLYEWGAFIAHNPECVPGLGSCIFLHLTPGPGKATAGCTALTAEDLQTVLRWLDAGKEPRLVQGLETW